MRVDAHPEHAHADDRVNPEQSAPHLITTRENEKHTQCKAISKFSLFQDSTKRKDIVIANISRFMACTFG